MCRQRFADDSTKSFVLSAPATFADPARFLAADLAISLDVVYHLVEQDVFDAYLHSLFTAAERFVIAYSSDHDAPALGHVRHRAVLAVGRNGLSRVAADRTRRQSVSLRRA